MGQTFAALEYLHGNDCLHGNLDPRSILIMSRRRLWVKLTDFGLCSHVELGKPHDYHAMYASQAVPRYPSKFPADVWSAGVVALHLLKKDCFRGCQSVGQCFRVSVLVDVASELNKKLMNDATACITKVLHYSFPLRPTATEVLKDPWIVRTRGEAPPNNPHYSLDTPPISPLATPEPYDDFNTEDSTSPSVSSVQSTHPSILSSEAKPLEQPE